MMIILAIEFFIDLINENNRPTIENMCESSDKSQARVFGDVLSVGRRRVDISNLMLRVNQILGLGQYMNKISLRSYVVILDEGRKIKSAFKIWNRSKAH